MLEHKEEGESLIYDYLVDTDVIIWYLRGNSKAKELLRELNNFAISAITYMELVQGMRNKEELRVLQKFIKLWGIKIIYIDEDISAKALNSVEEYFLSNSLEIADALIGATALKYGLILVTANNKHYRVFKDLEIKVFRP
jgi:predicted nucleic acid-binding protein